MSRNSFSGALPALACLLGSHNVTCPHRERKDCAILKAFVYVEANGSNFLYYYRVDRVVVQKVFLMFTMADC